MAAKFPPKTPGASTDKLGIQLKAQYEQGIITFGLLFTRWMDQNGWSHPVMTGLSKACMGGLAWLHSSQLSGFRQGRLISPGPRSFIAIERLNYYLWLYQTEKKLIPGTTSSNHYSDPFVITENGQPPELGWWFDVFCGVRVPTDIDLKKSAFNESTAEIFSKNWGRYTRRLLVTEGYDLIEDLETAVREHYPARDDARVAKTLDVLRNKAVWTPFELANELPALVHMSGALAGHDSEVALLKGLL